MALSFGLNRLNTRSPKHFADDAKKLENLGWDYGFIPSSPLLVEDPYVLLATALEATSCIKLGPLIENPIMRHPAVIAGSIATVDRLAPGRAILGMGVGDTAVRLMGKKPASVQELKNSIETIQGLLNNRPVDVDAPQPAKLRHASPVPVWIAAQGPKTLRMAGQVCDGVFIRVGTHEENLRIAVEAVHEGAKEVGRDVKDITIGCVFHTVLDEDTSRAERIGRAMAAGYYEYSPHLFRNLDLDWNGPDIELLKTKVWPDFHHAANLERAGNVVKFLPDEAAHAFCLHGDFKAIINQIETIMNYQLPISVIIPHPVPNPSKGSPTYSYADRFAKEVFPAF